jgi:hypothetical protein
VGADSFVENEMRVTYYVEDETLQKDEEELSEYEESRGAPRPGIRSRPAFYRYDISENKAKKISFEKAREYELDTSEQSPEGFGIVRQNSPYFFDLGGYDRQKQFLKGDYYRKELNLKYPRGNCYHGFQFLGWIVSR